MLTPPVESGLVIEGFDMSKKDGRRYFAGNHIDVNLNKSEQPGKVAWYILEEDIVDEEGFDWVVYWSWSSSVVAGEKGRLLVNVKLVAKGKVPSKANYWLGMEHYKLTSRGGQHLTLKEHRPGLYDLVEKGLANEFRTHRSAEGRWRG